MPEQTTPATGAVEVSTVDEFAAFEASRNNGEFPTEAKSSEAAAETEKPADEKEAKTAPESDPADKQEETEEGEDGKPAAKKGGFQRRIDKLTRERHQLEGRLQEMERQLAGKPAEQPSQEAKPAADGKPKMEDCESVEEYVEKLTDWKADQSKKAEAASKAQEAHEATMQSWAEKRDAAREEFEDFDKVLANRELRLSPAMQAVIFDSPHGAHLAYELGKNPAEAQRIYALSPVAAARELLKLESKFAEPDKTPAKEKPKASAAPEPIKPVSGAKSGTSHDPYGLETNDFEKFEKVRIRELRGA